MRIFAMGYSWTGSSAVVHLVKEYDNCCEDFDRAYEHVLFYAPHGLFDLENTILNNNTLYRSDAAINDFYKAMKYLNDNDFGWFGGYQKRFGNAFMKIVEDFISSLVEFSRDGGWSNDYSYSFSFKNLIIDLKNTLLRKRGFHDLKSAGTRLVTGGNDNKVNFCFDSPEEFYKKARVFVDAYFEMIGYKEDQIIVTDQILQPQHLKKFINYAHEDDKFIVLRRDPRDMFLSAKYIWSRWSHLFIFPRDSVKFCSFYKRFLSTETIVNDSRILRLYFEDMIYKYDETVSKIEQFVGIDRLGNHSYKRQFFNPDKSIKNTQIFSINEEWRNEIKPIEVEMKDYLYDFPFEANTTIAETSDPNPNTSRK